MGLPALLFQTCPSKQGGLTAGLLWSVWATLWHSLEQPLADPSYSPLPINMPFPKRAKQEPLSHRHRSLSTYRFVPTTNHQQQPTTNHNHNNNQQPTTNNQPPTTNHQLQPTTTTTATTTTTTNNNNNRQPTTTNDTNNNNKPKKNNSNINTTTTVWPPTITSARQWRCCRDMPGYVSASTRGGSFPCTAVT